MELQFRRTIKAELPLLEKWHSTISVRKWIYIDDWTEYWNTVSALSEYYLYSVYEEERMVAWISAEIINATVAVCIIVDPLKQHRGIGTAVVRKMLSNSQVLFGAGIRSFHAAIYEGNTASRRLFEKCGFQCQNISKDGERSYCFIL